jgi:hypothetical protein
MKIGFSVGRCIRDIVNGEIELADVAFIIGSTAMRDKEHLTHVIDAYMAREGYLYGMDQLECQTVAEQLWDMNKILQPRLQGMHRHRQPESSIWVDMFPTELSNNQSVKSAWKNYRTMLHMVENVDEEALEVFK